MKDKRQIIKQRIAELQAELDLLNEQEYREKLEQQANQVVGRLNEETSRDAFFVLLDDFHATGWSVDLLLNSASQIVRACELVDSKNLIEYLIEERPYYDVALVNS